MIKLEERFTLFELVMYHVIYLTVAHVGIKSNLITTNTEILHTST